MGRGGAAAAGPVLLQVIQTECACSRLNDRHPDRLTCVDSFTFGGGRGYEYVDSLYFFSPSGNPATVHSSLECALMTSCVQRPLVLALRAPLLLRLTGPHCWLDRDHAVVTNQNISHVIYEDLAIRNGGADGMWFVSCSHVTVRHLDISWIGGGCLMPGPRWKDKKECTRFGNGVEFPDFVSPPTAAAVYRCLVCVIR